MIGKGRSFFVLIIVLFFGANATAQHDLGLATGDNCALNSLFINPANIAGANEKIEVGLFSLNLAVDNNIGTFTNLGNLGNNNTGIINFTGNGNFSALLPAVDVHLPGVMVSLSDPLEQSFALTTRIRAMNQFNNFAQDLYSTVRDNNRTNNQDLHYRTQNFNWTAHVWSEVGLTYALKAYDNGPNQIRAGVTLRILGGIDYLSLKGKNLDIDYTAGNDTFHAYNSDLEFASNAISANNAYANGLSSSGILSQFFGSKAGSGFGMDIGATYTYAIGADEYDDNDGHRLKIGAAVTDFGSIKYKEGSNFVVNVTGNGYLTGQGLSDHIKDYTDLRNYAVTQGYTVDTGSKATKVYMPTALNITADYQVYQKVYVNAFFLANLANRQNYGNSYYNQVTVTPRYDTKIFSVGLPISYSTLASELKLGVGFRVGGFFFGSDDMLALFSSNQHGVNVYFGGYVPLFKKKSKDPFGPK